MSSYSFGIKNSQDLFKKLMEDCSDLQKNQISSRHAINCAMTAWHLTDWIFIEFKNKHKFTDLGQFRASLNCSSLNLMHDIANGSKHLNLSKPKSDISNTNLHEGDFDLNDFSDEFDIDRLEIEMLNGDKKDFKVELGLVIQFWGNYLQNI